MPIAKHPPPSPNFDAGRRRIKKRKKGEKTLNGIQRRGNGGKWWYRKVTGRVRERACILEMI